MGIHTLGIKTPRLSLIKENWHFFLRLFQSPLKTYNIAI